MKEVIWYGNSLRHLRQFPRPIQSHVGFALERLQRGDLVINRKKFDASSWQLSFGNEVGWFRVLFYERDGKIVVTHAFRKATQRTEQGDVDLAWREYRHSLRSIFGESAARA